jgi:signal transduction histidine kinase/HAMP domain-containing protein
MPSSGSARADTPPSRIWSRLVRPWWQRIAFRLILLLLAVSIVPPLTLGILAMRSARVAQEREVWEGNTALARWGVDKVQSYLANIEEDMRLIVEVGNLQTMDPATAKPLLLFLLSFTEDIKELSLLDATGRERVKVAEGTLITADDLKSRADTPTLQIPLSGETYVGPVRTSEFSEPFVSIVVPIRNLAENKIVGALAAEVNLKRLWDDMLSFKVGKSGYLYLVNEAGQPLAHPDFSLVLSRKDLRSAGAVRRFLAGEDDVPPRANLEYLNYQGIQVVGLHARIPKLGWAVVVEQPSAEAFANVNRMKIETWLVLVNAVIVTLVVTLLCARSFTGPLAQLADGARRFGTGEFAHRIPIRSRDEIAEVADGFNAMADRVQESFQHLRILLETSAMTSASLELDHVIRAALHQMDHLAGWPNSGVVLLETPANGRQRMTATIRTLRTSREGYAIEVTPDALPNLWRALTQEKAVAIGDFSARAGPGEHAVWDAPNLQAMILAPLLSKGTPRGALWIGRAQPGPLSEEEVLLAQTMANHVAIAIENARLHGATVRRGEQLEALLRASRTVMAGLDLREILDRILDEAARISGAPHVKVLLLDKESGTLRVGALKGSAMPPDFSFPVGLGSSGIVAQTGEPLFMSDAQHDSRSIFAERDRELGIVTYLGLPIKRGQDVLGVLTFNTTVPHQYTPDEIAYLASFADQAAIAIDNARLYAALRRTSAELESRVEERTRELRDAHEGLVRAERLALIGQLAGGVGHELRNPLGGIGNAVYYLRMRLADGQDPKIQKHLGILDAEVRRANKIVTDLLDFSRIKEPSRAPAQLNAIVMDILARQREIPTIAVDCKLAEGLPPVLVDADQVGQVFLNLILNAVEAMPEGGTLTIQTEATTESVIARFTDSGVGITPENLEKIFQPLFTTKTKGIGLGLAVSRRLTEANGGTLTVASRPGQGATFTATFPRAGDKSSGRS